MLLRKVLLFFLIVFIFRKVSASWTLVFIVSLVVEEAVSQMKTLVPFIAKHSQKMRDLKNSSHIKRRTNPISAAAHREMKVMRAPFVGCRCEAVIFCEFCLPGLSWA